MNSNDAPYGYRTVIQCNCGMVFTTEGDLFAHMHEADPEALGEHHNMSHRVPRSKREHDREQEEFERLQDARRRGQR
jgi:hypothetical protein